MEATNALVFALGTYVLALVVALFVGVVIVVIRRATAERAKVETTSTKTVVKAEEART